MSAAAFKIFGEGEFAARFPSAVCALLGIAATGLLGARLFGKRAGFLSALVTGTSLLYFAVGTISLTDMPVSAFITVAMTAFYLGATYADRRWYLLFYAAMAAAVLTKGLIGVVLPAGIVFWYAVITKKWRVILRVLYAPGILLFFVISVPWFYLVCRENPDFFRFFFIQEHFLRYATTMHDRYEPFWFFLPMIPAAVMPWTGFLVSLCGKGSVIRTPSSSEQKDANIFLLLWFGVILLFFSLSSSKLIPYITPCVPPLAVLISSNMERMMRENRWICGAHAWNVGFGILLASALFASALFNDRIGRNETLALAAILSVSLVGGPCFALRYWAVRRNVSVTIASLGACALIFTLSLQLIYIPVAETRSAVTLAETVTENRQPGERIAVYGEILQGVPFYAKERVILVNHLGELAYGAGEAGEAEKSEWFPNSSEFLGRWSAGEPLALITEKKRAGDLFEEGRSGDKKAIDVGDYVIIFNRRD
jgi:4-amino-4-deoxy-L-arabinose transferase-like glycosyltransferase